MSEKQKDPGLADHSSGRKFLKGAAKVAVVTGLIVGGVALDRRDQADIREVFIDGMAVDHDYPAGAHDNTPVVLTKNVSGGLEVRTVNGALLVRDQDGDGKIGTTEILRGANPVREQQALYAQAVHAAMKGDEGK